MIFGAIPVKKESTRFPGKNFQMLGDEYLINLAIYRLMPYVDRIIISTDAVDRVQSIMGNLGTGSHINQFKPEVHIEILDRSDEARHGDLPSNFPIRDAFSKMDLTWGHNDLVVMTQVTSPLIRGQTVERCIAEMQKGSLVPGPSTDLVVTVDPDLNPNGGVYVCKAPHLFQPGSFYKGRVHLHVVPFKESIDIDYPHQLSIAESIVRGDIS